MPFEDSKDHVLESVVGIEGTTSRILVQIAQYNGGKKKLGLKRESRSGSGWSFSKLGRMEPREFIEIVPIALSLLDKHGLMEG